MINNKFAEVRSNFNTYIKKQYLGMYFCSIASSQSWSNTHTITFCLSADKDNTRVLIEPIFWGLIITRTCRHPVATEHIQFEYIQNIQFEYVQNIQFEYVQNIQFEYIEIDQHLSPENI